jgi:hypothetical protein
MKNVIYRQLFLSPDQKWIDTAATRCCRSINCMLARGWKIGQAVRGAINQFMPEVMPEIMPVGLSMEVIPAFPLQLQCILA